MNRPWKQYSLAQDIKVDRHLVWTMLKLWVKKKTYRVTISFYAQHNSETKFNSVQVEY
jgi:hypothetical protein